MTDYKGNVLDAHAPEMPTRFAKQLSQVVRGGRAVGMTLDRAVTLALRLARDSMPPVRWRVLQALVDQHWLRTSKIKDAIQKPWLTADRQLQALHLLGVLDRDEFSEGAKTIAIYRLRDEFRATVRLLAGVPEMSATAA